MGSYTRQPLVRFAGKVTLSHTGVSRVGDLASRVTDDYDQTYVHDFVQRMRLLLAGESATRTRVPQLYVHVFRLLHHLRLFFHSQPFHRRHHRQLQHAETQGNQDWLSHRPSSV